MSLEKKIVDLNNSETKSPIVKKKPTTPKKINLCKKYFYIDKNKALNLKQFSKGQILQLMENNSKGKRDVLEEVDYVMTQFEQKKLELHKKKIDCIKSMILNNKNIPEKWIMRPDYKGLLNEAMEDDIVLNYAIVCKDKYKKVSGEDENVEEKYLNYLKSLKPEKKFISYINLYSRNYVDTPIKKKLMREYCLSIQRNDDSNISKMEKNKYNNPLNIYVKKGVLSNKLNNEKRKSRIDDISDIKNKLPLINQKGKVKEKENNLYQKNEINNRYNESKDDLMLTSLHYTGLDINNKNNKVQEIDSTGNYKALKLPEII